MKIEGKTGRNEAMCTYLNCLECGEARMGEKLLAGWLEGNSQHIHLFLKSGATLAELAQWSFNLLFALWCLLLTFYWQLKTCPLRLWHHLWHIISTKTQSLYQLLHFLITWGHKNIIYRVWKWQFNKQYKLKENDSLCCFTWDGIYVLLHTKAKLGFVN